AFLKVVADQRDEVAVADSGAHSIRLGISVVTEGVDRLQSAAGAAATASSAALATASATLLLVLVALAGGNRVRRTEAQRSRRNSNNTLQSLGQNSNIGGHTGEQFQIRIADLHDHVIGDHVLHVDRGAADLRHFALEELPGIGVYGECRALA